MDIILHIGTEKTGTTYLQNTLHHCRSELSTQGIYFPDFPMGQAVSLTACSIGREYSNPLLSVLGVQSESDFDRLLESTRSIIESGLHGKVFEKILLSDEHLSAYMPSISAVRKLRQILSKYGQVTKIVMYIRRQDDLVLSIMSQAIKNRSLKGINFEEPYGNLKLRSKRLNYWRNLQFLKKVFPEVTFVVKPYGKSFFEGGSLLNDFCNTIGCSLSDAARSLDKQNISIHPLYFKALVRILNSDVFRQNATSELNAEWSGFVRDLSLVCKLTKGVRFDTNVIRRFNALYAAQNRRLINDYGVDQEFLLSDPIQQQTLPSYENDSFSLSDFEKRIRELLGDIESKYPLLCRALQSLKESSITSGSLPKKSQNPDYEILKDSLVFDDYIDGKYSMTIEESTSVLKDIFARKETSLIVQIRICEELHELRNMELTLEYMEVIRSRISKNGCNPFILGRFSSLSNKLNQPEVQIIEFWEQCSARSQKSSNWDLGYANLLFEFSRNEDALTFLFERAEDWLDAGLLIRVAEHFVGEGESSKAREALKRALEYGLTHNFQINRFLNLATKCDCVFWGIEPYLEKEFSES